MDIRYELADTLFIWNDKKAVNNPNLHYGITFEQAATVFFDPFFRMVDTGRNNEARDAIIGFGTSGGL